jgi:NADH-quinone oxidoreductase subunit C
MEMWMESTHENAQISEALKSVFARIESEFGAKLLGSTVFRGELTFVVEVKDLIDVLRFCKESLGFDRLDCFVGNHYPEREDAPMEVIAHLTSMSQGTRLRIKTPLAEGQSCPTLTALWPSANWDEREIYEMFGIQFEGHPNLIRLLTIPDFEGFPLRKDFPLRGYVGGRIRTDLKGKL